MRKNSTIKSLIFKGLSQCLMVYAVVISLAPCRGDWYQPKTPEQLHR